MGCEREDSDDTTHTHTLTHTHTYTLTHTHTLADYKSRGGQLPVRWTAIEALENRKFNEKTDVWSFGILVHEIWTKAELPYNGWSNQKVWVEVAAGYRLPQPNACRDDIFQHMLSCWNESQDERPTFREAAEFFRDLYLQLTGTDLRAKAEDYLEVCVVTLWLWFVCLCYFFFSGSGARG